MTKAQSMHTPKQILASLRNGNYAHPGEEEAIEISMRFIDKISSQKLLDVGCGLGGTADYLHQNGWGVPIGIDIDKPSIDFAQNTYPKLNFHQINVEQVAQKFAHEDFAVAYLFNSFYAFADQLQALKQVRKVCSANAKLVLFDYMLYEDCEDNFLPFAPENSIYARKNFKPIKQNSIENLLRQSGWQVRIFTDLGDKYQLWYSELIDKCHLHKEELIKNFNLDLYTWLESSYTSLLNRLKQNKLSGCLIIADAI